MEVECENTIALAALDGKLYSVETNGTLYETITDETWRQIGDDCEFQNLEMLVAMGGFLWTVESGTLCKTSITALDWQQVGEIAEWETAIAMTASNGFIWSVEKDRTLFKTNINEEHEQVGPAGVM